MNLIKVFQSMDNSDKYTLAGLVATLSLWWVFVGRGKYGTKGKRHYV